MFGFRSVVRQFVFAALVAALPITAHAEQVEFKAFGHTIKTVEAEDSEEALLIDGKKVHQNGLISFGEYAIMDGVGVIIGSSGTGGNACEDAPFVISFPKGQAPRFDGPVDTCLTTKVTVGQSEISFEEPTSPGQPGHRWLWTVQDGLRATSDVQPVVAASAGWAALKSHKLKYAQDFLNYKDFSSLLEQLTGADWKMIPDLASGPGSMNYADGIVVASACQAHNCDQQGLLVVADLSQQILYAAWKLENRRIAVSPIVKTWPAPAKGALLEWSKGFGYTPGAQ